MFIFKTIDDLREYLDDQKQKGKMIGFSPTLGALHEGHLSLIRKSAEHADINVASIFVNPTQFNDPEDLKKYPRTIEEDIVKLCSVDCDVLFMPEAAEVYPPDLDTPVELDFEGLDEVLEGAFRPGHFKGVAEVVKRLLDIVQPNFLIMGQKDFQQFTIIGHMIRELDLPVQLIVGETKREEDGLAMSSRNRRLTPDIRSRATILRKTLLHVKENIEKSNPIDLQESAIAALTMPDFKPEYFRIVDGYTLQPVTDFSKCDYAVAVTAVWAGDVRLIDNEILYKN
jgi:pantoate--beta-alanine ligase